MFVINQPHTLKDSLKTLLPELVQRLGRGKGQGFSLE
jgi:23S rRNA A2030 N6-methylase RlmJ